MILLTGVLIYMIRAWKESEWPFVNVSYDTKS